ncbi:MAG: MBL fold metallo-hydrolase [Ruminococcus sp.]|nr:MBL fold metallo-hydrolase [Ruminococcus sp.]
MNITVIASGSSGNAYRISDGETALLLDAGVPLKTIRQALNFRVRDLSGCLITHCHGDHSKAAGDLAKAGVDIYTSQGTIEACRLTGHRIKMIKALKEFTVGTFAILPFDVQHDAPEPLGFIVTSKATGEKLLYFTDTYYLKYRFQGLTHIMGECNYSMDIVEQSVRSGCIPPELVPRLIKSHMSLDHFLDLLRANDLQQVRQIYILHLSANNSDAERFKTAVQRLTGTEVYVC